MLGWAGLGLASDHLAHACFNPFSIQSHLTPLISGSLIRPRHVTRLARFRMLRVNPFTAVGAVWNSLFCSPTYLVSDKSKKKKNLALFLEKKKSTHCLPSLVPLTSHDKCCCCCRCNPRNTTATSQKFPGKPVSYLEKTSPRLVQLAPGSAANPSTKEQL